MSDISFTQYMRPNGRPDCGRGPSERGAAEVLIDRPQDIVDKANQIIDAGFRFEVEHLQTGYASLTIHDPRTEIDVAIQIVPNNPEVLDAVDRMIREFEFKGE